MIALIVGVHPITAVGAAYSFDPDTDYLTAATDFAPWAALIARHNVQTTELEACIADAAQCSNALKGYREIVVEGEVLGAEQKMHLVNRFINGRRWSIEPYRADDWRTLDEFLRRGGDCEDFALAKYFLLRRLGFSIDDVRVAITWDRQVRDYHAVTLVHLDGRVYVLDVDGPPRLGQNNYRFLFSINESGVWDHARDPKRLANDLHHPTGAQHL
jgi:predicted transglutaminase-like cysteine proteinase